MENETQQAQEALQAIAKAEAGVEQHSLNNGTVPLVWGAVILTDLAGFDLLPAHIAALASGLLPAAAAIWTALYTKSLPVLPRQVKQKRLFAWWALYHATVLIGGLLLATRVWHIEWGAWMLIGLVDAAPLIYVGWRMRRASKREAQR